MGVLASTQVGGCDHYGGGSKPALSSGSLVFIVASIVPVDGASGVATSASLFVGFSRDADPATVNPANLTLVETATSTPVTISISYDSSNYVAQVLPGSTLTPNTSYTLAVSTNILDLSGNPLDAPLAVTFMTGAGVDTIPPTFSGAISAQPESSDAILVSWTAATDDTDPPPSIRFFIYVATSPGGQNFGAPTSVTYPAATSYIVANLSELTTYYAVVRAVDTSGNTDSNVVEVSATTPATPTGAISWLSDVWMPILLNRCQDCHTNDQGAQVFTMKTAPGAYANLVDVQAIAGCLSLKRVKPFSSAESALYLRISGWTCGDRMPLGITPLTAAQITTIRDWIDQGAPNN